jgi:hypothetical protein
MKSSPSPAATRLATLGLLVIGIALVLWLILGNRPAGSPPSGQSSSDSTSSGGGAAPAVVDADYLACRTAIERVYHSHRENAPAFDQVYTADVMQKRVAEELLRERILAEVFNVQISDGELSAELDRIHQSTQAPDVLAELEAALGNDDARIKACLVKPLLVDRFLRDAYANNTAIHQATYDEANRMRERVLSGESMKAVGGERYSEVIYDANARPMGEPPAPGTPQVAPLSSMDAETKQIVEEQLKQTGDVSQVIGGRDDFKLMRLAERRSDRVVLELILIPKRTFDQWFAEERQKRGQ